MAYGKERSRGGASPEFRAEMVRQFLESGRPLPEMARQLGVPHQTLWAWVNKAKLKAIDPGGDLPVEARRKIRDLERENARLRRDLEFEKKAGAFFRELDRDETDSL